MGNEQDQMKLFGGDGIRWEDLPHDARRRCLDALGRMLEIVVRGEGRDEG